MIGATHRGEHKDQRGSIVRGRARGVDHGKDMGGDPVEVRDSMWLPVEQVRAGVRFTLLKVLTK